MAKKQFKTESKRLLDLMANSIYTNTDIFLRELISNASDALDKKYYLSLTDSTIDANNLKIQIEVDSKARTITIKDNGIGMNRADLDENLGTIAKSGSFDFKKDLDTKEEIDIIGQFGVGFYSAFMVASKIEVLTKKYNEEKAYLWVSEDEEGYEIKNAKKDEVGTTITLSIKENTKEKKYDDYLSKDTIQMLIKKYSDYIRYPIEMEVEVMRSTGEQGKTERSLETKVINSMVPLWKKNKKDIQKEDYDEFYMNSFYDYNEPLETLHYNTEGNTSYTALLYIPSKAPYNYYSADYKVGLKLYSKGVFIKDEANELISDHFRFVRGLIDSDDLNLNISREILQQDYQMKNLKKSIDKKIKNTLEKMMEKDREKYERFFKEFGTQIKFGAYENYGINKDLLIDLILFKSSHEDQYVSLKEYVSRMKEDQKEIYYACGESIEKIKEMPQIERVLDAGYEVLYFLENVDEFMATILMNYDEKPFKSINKGDLNLDSEEEKEETQKKSEENKDLLLEIRTHLNADVIDVRLSNRLKSHPVCLVSDDQLSLEMEKILKDMNQQEVHANKILEINPNHPLFDALKQKYENNDNIEDYAKLLYDQACLIAGLPIEDPIAYSKRMSDLMIQAMK